MAAIGSASLTRIVAAIVVASLTRTRAIAKPVTGVSAKGGNWGGPNDQGFYNRRKLGQKLGAGLSTSAFGNSMSMLITALGLLATGAVICNTIVCNSRVADLGP